MNEALPCSWWTRALDVAARRHGVVAARRQVPAACAPATELLERGRRGRRLVSALQVSFHVPGDGHESADQAALRTRLEQLEQVRARRGWTDAIVRGSDGRTPNSCDSTSCVSASDTAIPAATPIAVSTRPRPITMRDTSDCRAPIAMRMPISRVRCETEYAITP